MTAAQTGLPSPQIFKKEGPAPKSGARIRSQMHASPMMTSQATSLLCVQNGHDFHRPWIDDYDLVPDHEIFISAPCRFDFHNGPRKSSEPHGARHSGADRYAEVWAADARSVPLVDDYFVYSGTLLRWEIDVSSRPSRPLAGGLAILLGSVGPAPFPL
jgi:hypothetical protein